MCQHIVSTVYSYTCNTNYIKNKLDTLHTHFATTDYWIGSKIELVIRITCNIYVTNVSIIYMYIMYKFEHVNSFIFSSIYDTDRPTILRKWQINYALI